MIVYSKPSPVQMPLQLAWEDTAVSTVYPTSPKFGKADSYEKLEKLGEGSYATVYKGKSNAKCGLGHGMRRQVRGSFVGKTDNELG
ncbi:hypothetical protein P7K49_025368, partial [Saguinus oedipus]